MKLSAAHLAGAALVAAGLLAGCTAAPTASPAPNSAPSVTPSATTTASASATPGTDPGAPDTPETPGTRVRPGLNGVPDPATLPTSGSRATPNLGNADLVQPTMTLASLPDSPVLTKGYSGAKVNLIQQKLGIKQVDSAGRLKIQEMDSDTMDAVSKWQKNNGLDGTGEVGPKTWAKMFPDVPWSIDHFRTPVALPTTATANARIEAMIDYMRGEVGAKYVWGSAGPKKYGYDCSGLMLQAMYHAGIDPKPINVVDHQGPDYPTAQKLYDYAGFEHVPVADAKRGDMVFYGPKGSDRVTHVAMFLDNGFVLEAITSLGVSEDHYYTSFRGGDFVQRPDAVRIVS